MSADEMQSVLLEGERCELATGTLVERAEGSNPPVYRLRYEAGGVSVVLTGEEIRQLAELAGIVVSER